MASEALVRAWARVPNPVVQPPPAAPPAPPKARDVPAPRVPASEATVMASRLVARHSVTAALLQQKIQAALPQKPAAAGASASRIPTTDPPVRGPSKAS